MLQFGPGLPVYAPINPATGGTPDDSALGVLYAQPGAFGNALAHNYGSYAGGLSGLANAYGNAYGAYGAGLSSLATARANEASARYAANAMAEAARQGATGNIGSAALGAYGAASNSALGAWAANQQAYNDAVARSHNADQQGMSQYGASRNMALGQLGNAYGDIGKMQAATNAVSNLNFSGNLGGLGGFGGGGGGGGFVANSPTSQIASGSYSTFGQRPTGGGGSGNLSLTSSSNRTSTPVNNPSSTGALTGLSDLQSNLMSGDIIDAMRGNTVSNANRLDAQHYSSRGMPSQMLNQALGGLMQLGNTAYQNTNAGMNQYYANSQMNEMPYQQFGNALAGGYRNVGSQLRGTQRDLRSGYGTANDGVNKIFNNTIARVPAWDPDKLPKQGFWSTPPTTGPHSLTIRAF